MNILFVISSLANKAPVKLLFDIANGMKMKGQNVFVLTLNPENENSLLGYFTENNIEVLSLNRGKLECEIFTWKISKLVEDIIKAKKIDIIHCSCYNSVIICSKIKSIKKSLTFHNYCTEDYPLSKGYVLGNYMAYRFLHAVKTFEYPIAISQTMQEFYKKKLHRKDIYYVYNGIDTDKFAPVEENLRGKIRKNLNLPVDKKIYIVCGILTKRKDPITIIEAFKTANLPNAILLFIGDGPLMQIAVSHANENIIFKGFVSNSEDYLKASDCLISAAHSEGLPLNVIEGMSVGLPLILSAIPAHTEIVSLKCSNSVFLFSINAIDALAEEIKKIEYVNYYDNCSMTHQKTKEKFSKEIMVKNFKKIFIS